jgi:putative ABC transport system permease protein
MNFLELILKQMRQRALSTWLTLLSVTLGVTLAVAILIAQREAGKMLGQSEFGYDVLIGVKGSKFQLVLNTVYQLDQSPGNVTYAVYSTLPERFPGAYRWALPMAVGDQYEGLRIIATLPKAFETEQTRKAFDEMQQLMERQRLNAVAIQQSRPGTQERLDAVDKLRVISEDLVELRSMAMEIDEEAAAGLDVASKLLRDALDALSAPDAPAAAVVERLKEARRALLRSAPLLGIFEYRPDRKLRLAQGRAFDRLKFEAVVGADVTRRVGLKVGDRFKATHGVTETSAMSKDDHDHNEEWEVVGVMERTHTALDRVILIPLVTFYAIPAHEQALVKMAEVRGVEEEAPTSPTAPRASPRASSDDWDTGFSSGGHEHPYFFGADGRIVLDLPKSKWKLSALAVRSRGPVQAQQMMWEFNNGPDAQAVNPASEMRQFFDTFLAASTKTLLVLSVLVTVVAAVSILVSIYNSVAARRREIAILRALGATRLKVLALITLEAGLIGLLGAVAGWVLGHSLAGVGSVALNQLVGERLDWLAVSSVELLYLLGVVGLAALAGLVPALKAYQTPVAANLVAE